MTNLPFSISHSPHHPIRLQRAHPESLLRAYRFRRSLADVAFISATRSVIAILSYACLSTRANLYRPYVYTSIGVAAAVAIFVAIKGALYDYSIEPSWMVWRRCPETLSLHSPGLSCEYLFRRPQYSSA